MEDLALQELYIEDIPGSCRILSRLFDTACFHVVNHDPLDVIIIFEDADLGITGTAQAQTRERIDDLGLRLVIVSASAATKADGSTVDGGFL